MKAMLHTTLLLAMGIILALTSCDHKDSDLFVPKKVADGLDFPEGPAWNGKDLLVLSNCYGGWIAEYSETGLDTFVSKQQHPNLFDKTNGLTFGKDGNIYACEYGLGAILQIAPDKKITTLIPGYEGQPFNRPNDLAFAANGNLYFTDPKSYDRENRDGVVYKYAHASGDLKVLISGLAFPNGIAFSGDGQYLYVCESAMNRILKYAVINDSTVGPPDVFIELPGGDPDGIAFDIKGNLYAAHFGSGKVFTINPAGGIIREIAMPGKKPTNVEFGGPDMRTLYITEVETNSLYRVNVDIPGQRLF